MSELAQLIGKPWISGAAGPDAFDCWGLVRHVQRDFYGMDLSHVAVDRTNHASLVRTFEHSPERGNWRYERIPADGDLVEMGSARHPHHIGVYVAVDGGKVIHSVEGAGVGAQTVERLRLTGWTMVRFLRHISKP